MLHAQSCFSPVSDLDDLCPGGIPWLVRCGTAILLVTLLFGFTLAGMISYHDIVLARIRLVQVPPSATLCSRFGGRITPLVENGEKVSEAEYLAITENPARTEDMLILKRLLAEDNDPARLYNLPLPDSGLALGEVQDLWARFEADLLEYKLLAEADFHKDRLTLARRTFDVARSAVEVLYAQEATAREHYALALRQMHNDSILFMKGYISPAELNGRFMDLLQKRQMLQVAHSAVLQQRSRTGELEREMYDEAKRLPGERKKCGQRVVTSFHALANGLRTWEENYVTMSPFPGRVSFVRFPDDNGFCKPGDEICTVVPENNTIIGRATLELFGSGKVAAGQPGKIKCDNYPYQEFGRIMATVQSVSIAPHEGSYVVLVNLTDGLVTDRGKRLPFMEGMQGMLEIVTERRTLLERLIDPVASVYRSIIDSTVDSTHGDSR